MRVSTIIIVAFFADHAQSMTVREHKNIQKMLQTVEDKMEHKIEQKVEQNVEQKAEQKSERPFEQNGERKQKLSFKTALESFTKCQKLRAKLMIKYRRNPRLFRRIKHLHLKC